jgi:hypothetical protein
LFVQKEQFEKAGEEDNLKTKLKVVFSDTHLRRRVACDNEMSKTRVFKRILGKEEEAARRVDLLTLFL